MAAHSGYITGQFRMALSGDNVPVGRMGLHAASRTGGDAIDIGAPYVTTAGT